MFQHPGRAWSTSSSRQRRCGPDQTANRPATKIITMIREKRLTSTKLPDLHQPTEEINHIHLCKFFSTPVSQCITTALMIKWVTTHLWCSINYNQHRIAQYILIIMITKKNFEILYMAWLKRNSQYSYRCLIICL